MLFDNVKIYKNFDSHVTFVRIHFIFETDNLIFSCNSKPHVYNDTTLLETYVLENKKRNKKRTIAVLCFSIKHGKNCIFLKPNPGLKLSTGKWSQNRGLHIERVPFRVPKNGPENWTPF